MKRNETELPHDKMIPVKDLPMSTRLANVLRRNQIEYLYQVEDYPEEVYLRLRNMGKETLNELCEICKPYGIKIYSRFDLEYRGILQNFSPEHYKIMFKAGIKTKEDIINTSESVIGELFGRDTVIFRNIMRLKLNYNKQE